MGNPDIQIDVTVSSHLWDKPSLSLKPLVHDVIDRSLALAKKPAALDKAKAIEVSIVLSDDEETRQLNKRYRGIDKSTNVLSFAALDGEITALPESIASYIHLGDLILAYETLEKESQALELSFKDHFIHLLVHGTLHLLGYDHQKNEEAEVMEGLEVLILTGLGIENPYSSEKNVA